MTNALANTGHGSTSAGAAVSHQRRNHGSARRLRAFRAGQHAAFGQSLRAFSSRRPYRSISRPALRLSEASAEIERAVQNLHMPATIHGSLQGTAQVFQSSLANEPLLIAAAVAAVYIVLGILYESYIHPITILSTLPSAGVGALLALMVFNTEFSIIALIGMILLIGIVKKNAIMMIDFAIEARRVEGMTAHEAIFQACLLRFRPIMMTTCAAILGAVPLALSFGEGGEIRRPLGISIVGGLILSQMLTLYTTPVLYLILDSFQEWVRGTRRPLANPPPHVAPDLAE